MAIIGAGSIKRGFDGCNVFHQKTRASSEMFSNRERHARGGGLHSPQDDTLGVRMRDYGIAKLVFNLIQIIGGIALAMSLLAAWRGGARFEAIMVVGPIVIGCLCVIAFGQLGLAMIATAENSEATVSLLREMDKREAARQRGPVTEHVKNYKGYQITRENGSYVAAGRSYATLILAEQAIDAIMREAGR